jgi:hypothetical protein
MRSSRQIGALLAAAAMLLATMQLGACAQIAGVADPLPAALEEGNAEGGASAPEGPLLDVDVQPAELDFGPVRCGEPEVGPKVITVHNRSAEDAPWSVQVPEGTQFVVKGASEGTLAPGATATVSVFVTAALAGETAAGLIVTAGGSVREVVAKASGSGAELAFVPRLVDFGDVRFQVGGPPIPVRLQNSGTETVTVGSFEGKTADFDLTWASKPAPLTIEPGTFATVEATFASGAEPSGGILETTFEPVVTGTLCGAVPELAARGKRIDTTVTISVADWGEQDCLTAEPGERDVTITNFSGSAIAYEGSLAASSAFRWVSPKSGTVEAGASANVTLAANATDGPVGLLEEEVGFLISGVPEPSGGPRATTARINVRGAVIEVTPASHLNYRYIPWGTDWKSFTLTNTGNAGVSLRYGLTRTDATGGTAWTFSSATFGVAAGGNRSMPVGFRPSRSGTFSANVNLTRTGGAKVCAPLPVPTVRGVR